MKKKWREMETFLDLAVPITEVPEVVMQLLDWWVTLHLYI